MISHKIQEDVSAQRAVSHSGTMLGQHSHPSRPVWVDGTGWPTAVTDVCCAWLSPGLADGKLASLPWEWAHSLSCDLSSPESLSWEGMDSAHCY